MFFFPALSADGCYPWRAISDSVDNDVAKDVRIDKSYVSGVFVYIRDFSDMAPVRLLVEKIAQHCAEVYQITFLLQRRQAASPR